MLKSSSSLQDVASLCKVSKALVSSVLKGGPASSIRCSEKTRRKILDCAESLGYAPNILAQAVSTGKSPIVLVSLHEVPVREEDVVDFFMNDYLVEGAKALRKSGLYMLHMPYSDEEEQLEQLGKAIKSGLGGGVIANFIPGKAGRLVEMLESSGLPHVIMGAPFCGSPVHVDVERGQFVSIISGAARELGYESYCIAGLAPSGDLAAVVEGGFFEDGPLMEALSKPDTLLVASGIACYRRMLASHPEAQGRLLLAEDRRYPVGSIKPAILLRSPNIKRIRLACGLLSGWMESGTPPTERRHVVDHGIDEVRLLADGK